MSDLWKRGRDSGKGMGSKPKGSHQALRVLRQEIPGIRKKALGDTDFPKQKWSSFIFNKIEVTRVL